MSSTAIIHSELSEEEILKLLTTHQNIEVYGERDKIGNWMYDLICEYGKNITCLTTDSMVRARDVNKMLDSMVNLELVDLYNANKLTAKKLGCMKVETIIMHKHDDLNINPIITNPYTKSLKLHLSFYRYDIVPNITLLEFECNKPAWFDRELVDICNNNKEAYISEQLANTKTPLD